MKKWVLIILLTFSLIGCSGPVKTEEINDITENLNSNRSITNFLVGELDYNHEVTTKYEGYQFINFWLYAKGNSEFEKLSDKEKYQTLSVISKEVEENTMNFEFECGEKKICEIDSISIGDYRVEPTSDKIVLLHKGEEVYSPTGEQPVTSTPNDNNANSQSITSAKKQNIHDYMDEQYKILTDNGNNYDPELHDPMVAKMASEVFGISEDEAGQIFIDIEVNGD